MWICCAALHLYPIAGGVSIQPGKKTLQRSTNSRRTACQRRFHHRVRRKSCHCSVSSAGAANRTEFLSTTPRQLVTTQQRCCCQAAVRLDQCIEGLKTHCSQSSGTRFWRVRPICKQKTAPNHEGWVPSILQTGRLFVGKTCLPQGQSCFPHGSQAECLRTMQIMC